MLLQYLYEVQSERKRETGVKHDQWFLQPKIMEEYAAWIKSQPFFKDVTRIIDPCAGDGAIRKFFPSIQMSDIDPQGPGVKKCDFLGTSFKHKPGTLVITNPPFGYKNTSVINWFNKAATFADHIVMIAPGSFQRNNIKNKLSTDFELIDEWRLPRNSFYWPAEGDQQKPVDVGAVAQIWSRTDTPRETVELNRKSEYFDFVKTAENADFAIRRIGRNAGEILDPQTANPSSSLYIKAKDRRVIKAAQYVNWGEIAGKVTGAKSLNQAQVVRAIEELL